MIAMPFSARTYDYCMAMMADFRKRIAEEQPHMAGRLTEPTIDFKLPVRVRLAGLWASVMFCYVYSDLISFYIPGRIAEVARGDMGPLGVANHALLVGVAAVMAVPGLLVALSMLLPTRSNRITNVTVGSVYTLMIAATMFTAPPHYVLLGLIEIALTGYIVFLAWHWPKSVGRLWLEGQLPDAGDR